MILRIFFDVFSDVEQGGNVVDITVTDGIPLCVGVRVFTLTTEHIVIVDNPVGTHIRLEADFKVFRLLVPPDSIDHPLFKGGGKVGKFVGVDGVTGVLHIIWLTVNVPFLALMFLDIGDDLIIEGVKIRDVLHTLLADFDGFNGRIRDVGAGVRAKGGAITHSAVLFWGIEYRHNVVQLGFNQPKGLEAPEEAGHLRTTFKCKFNFVSELDAGVDEFNSSHISCFYWLHYTIIQLSCQTLPVVLQRVNYFPQVVGSKEVLFFKVVPQ